MSASREQIAPLALSALQSPSGDEGEAAAVASKQSRLRRRRRCLICGGCCGAFLVVLAIVIVVLAFTVFRVRDPEITVNSVSVQRVAVDLPALSFAPQQFFSLNLTLLVDLSIKNPNAASVRFGPSTTAVYFNGRELGVARGPPGNSRAHRTFRMNVTVDIMAERVVGDVQLLGELTSGVLPVTTSTRLGGRVKLLGVIRRHVDVTMNCSLSIDLASQSVQQQNCDRDVRL
ncbi:late embryogenesis abundant protein At1g64065-like [Curcuma longa]|uniref:late embryogenesis abundant protein At1g64065-like n=1 Tax=Curcuma longa TaxID=136217 RepID=UPI003D9F0E1F